MRVVLGVEEEWLPTLLPNKCTFSDPLDQPPPAYSNVTGIFVCNSVCLSAFLFVYPSVQTSLCPSLCPSLALLYLIFLNLAPTNKSPIFP